MPHDDDNIQFQLQEIASSLETADTQFRIGNYDGAEPIYRRALSFLEEQFGPGDPDTIACLQKLADTYFHMRRFYDALPHYKRLLAIGEKILGKHHPDVVAMSLKVASTYEQLDLRQDAMAMYERANRLSRTSIAALKVIPDPLQAPPAGSPPSKKAGEPPTSAPQSSLPAADRADDGDEGDEVQSWRNLANRVPAKQEESAREQEPQADDDDEDQPASKAGLGVQAGTSGRVIDARRLPGHFLEAQQVEYEPDDLEEPKHFATWKERKKGMRPTPAERGRAKSMRDRFISWTLTYRSMFSAALGLSVILGFGWFMLNKLNSEQASITKALSKLPALPSKNYKTVYATADNGKVLTIIAPDQATLAVRGKPALKVPLCRMGTDWKDYLNQLVNSLTHKEIWFQTVPQGLVDEDGSMLYSRDSAEQTVINNLHKVEDFANYYFKVRGAYPDDAGAFGNITLANPVNNKSETPDFHRLDISDSDPRVVIGSQPMSNDTIGTLQDPRTGLWVKESASVPGSVHCLTLRLGAPGTTSSASEFYAHGFDRTGNYIFTSSAGKVYLIAMRNGVNLVKPDPLTLPESKRPLRIVLMKSPWGNSNINARLLHFVPPLSLFCIALVLFCLAQLAKKKDEVSTHLTVFDCMALFMLLGSMIWAVAYAAP